MYPKSSFFLIVDASNSSTKANKQTKKNKFVKFVLLLNFKNIKTQTKSHVLLSSIRNGSMYDRHCIRV